MDRKDSSTSVATRALKRAVAKAKLSGELRRILDALREFERQAPGEVDEAVVAIESLQKRLEEEKD